MPTVIPLEAATVAALDSFVSRGRFASRDEAIRTALHIFEKTDEAESALSTAAEITGIERGLADVAAGRVFSAQQVYAELERRHAAGL